MLKLRVIDLLWTFIMFLTVVKMLDIITKQLHKNWLISAKYS